MNFAVSDIPSSVNTIEKLHVWTAAILAETSPDTNVQTDRNTLEPIATCQTYRFANELVDRERCVIATYIPLVPTWRGQGRLWENGVGEITTAALPAAYTS